MPAYLRVRSTVLLAVTVAVTLLASMLLVTPSASAATRARRITHGLTIARHQEGDPYRYGAAGPGRFDCSGLIYYSFRRAGFHHVPRTSSGQARHMRRIKKGHLRRGDFVFFYNGAARPGNVYHVGVFSGWHHGHRTIIHAPRPGQRVKRARIWTRHWFAGTLRGL
jgi:cell wall-associated NlpC family hydrolase